MAWRMAPFHDRLPEIGFGAVLAWVVISLCTGFATGSGGETPLPDAVAAAGAEYYRKELERRRDRLRNPWLWHGPLFLACAFCWRSWRRETFRGYQDLRNVLPLVVLLAVWTGYGVVRRRRQAVELQQEIDEMSLAALK